MYKFQEVKTQNIFEWQNKSLQFVLNIELKSGVFILSTQSNLIVARLFGLHSQSHSTP
jgi:hypothetical protein